MRILDATDDHMGAVLNMAAAFCAEAGEAFDRDHTLANIAGIRAGGFLLVGEDDIEGHPFVTGMLAAIPAPGLCSPAPVLHEVCLFVRPEERTGSTLLRLLREFDARAQTMRMSSQLSVLPTTPVALIDLYDRMGYQPVGSSFIKRRST